MNIHKSPHLVIEDRTILENQYKEKIISVILQWLDNNLEDKQYWHIPLGEIDPYFIENQIKTTKISPIDKKCLALFKAGKELESTVLDGIQINVSMSSDYFTITVLRQSVSPTIKKIKRRVHKKLV